MVSENKGNIIRERHWQPTIGERKDKQVHETLHRKLITKKHDPNQKLGVIRDTPEADSYPQAENIDQYTSNQVSYVLTRL